jgi:transcriptional regulator with XRE-family HTH domain
VDDVRFGAALRATRIRRGLRQVDIAQAAGVSPTTVGRVERGLGDGLPLDRIRAIARVLEIRVELLPRSRAADLDRTLNTRHAALAEAVIEWLGRYPGWEVRPELSFSWYGERGVVDIAAWHATSRTLLLIELKTELVDVGELLGTVDRRRRLASKIVAEFGWAPMLVGSLVVFGDSDTNRRRVAGHAATFEAALPDRIVRTRRWLAKPDGQLRGLMFFANRLPRTVSAAFATARRVRPAKLP